MLAEIPVTQAARLVRDSRPCALQSIPPRSIGQARLARRQTGFSLSELVIVLALIALLVGGILLGSGLVAQSRIKSLAKDFEGLALAVTVYADRYGALPGDDPQAELRWVGKSKNGTGDHRISGAYQAAPPAGDPLTALTVDGASGESLNFWWHLRLADLVVAPPPAVTQIAQPLNHFYGVVGVEWGAFGFPALALCAANLPGDVAIGIELQLDDGDPRRGFIRAAKQSSDNQPLAAADSTVATFAAADKYILCRRLD
jgi:prepilin-type N-terminal cleavage/methylation domain-containing protein